VQARAWPGSPVIWWVRAAQSTATLPGIALTGCHHADTIAKPPSP